MVVLDRGAGELMVVSGATQLSINIFTAVQENTELEKHQQDAVASLSLPRTHSHWDTFHYDYVSNGLLIVLNYKTPQKNIYLDRYNLSLKVYSGIKYF